MVLKNYQNLVLSSIKKLSSHYRYFLVTDNFYGKYSIIGSASPDLNHIIPLDYSKEDLVDKLFIEVENYYSSYNKLHDNSNKYYSEYKRRLTEKIFINDTYKIFTLGYGVIVTGSDLLVLDIDNSVQYKQLLELNPNIINESKFKRINISCKSRLHLYFKKPIGFEPSGNIRRISLRNKKLWISGLNNKTSPLAVDTSHMFRGPNYDYDLVGHMDDITECPLEIIDKICKDETKIKS